MLATFPDLKIWSKTELPIINHYKTMKKLIKIGCPSMVTPKLDLKMKLTAFFLLVFMLQINATTYSQKTKISLEMKKVMLSEVLNQIESISDFKFFVDTQQIDVKRKVDIKANNERISDILDKLFIGTNVTYEVYKKQILLKKLDVIPSKSNIDSPDKSYHQIEKLQQTVTGTVVDDNGMPLPGANILEKGTTNGTQADFDGNFTIALTNNDAILVVSYIGFATREVDIKGQTNISIVLEESSAGLDEVVVVGFGTQKKLNLTGAVSSIDSEDLENRPITSASQALQGMQGVYINQVGGQPGNDGATIRVRGVGTLNDNNPLVLVNGIEFSMNDLNPNDIESITVLKDAASAAIYGSRAANGVVLVTTKKGSQQSEIAYSSSVGVQEVISLPRVVKDPIRWMELYSQAQLNFGTNENALVFPQSLIDEYRTGMQTDPYTYPNNDWYDIMFDPALIHEHNLRFTGGSDKTSFSLSLGFLDQNGVLRSTDSERYTANLNVNSIMNEIVKEF